MYGQQSCLRAQKSFMKSTEVLWYIRANGTDHKHAVALRTSRHVSYQKYDRIY